MKVRQVKEKGRIDELLAKRGLAETKEKAAAVIMAGRVLAGGNVIDKPGTEIENDAEIVILEPRSYVSRGGIKLEGALHYFGVDVHDAVVMDIGSSTGGFTDCLLKKGAKKVFAVDVGKGLLDWRLRNDERVVVLEGRNIRYLPPDLIMGKDIGEKVDIAVIDVSFISLEKVIPKLKEFIRPKGLILALIKPQFEVQKRDVEKKGIIKDTTKHQMVIDRIRTFSEELGFLVRGVCESAIKGTKGNKEFWICMEMP
ncbi:MAG: TlyA family RNA methyltransferase [Deltaproteobacteria bacterium]|nr:TlyA family RNA methyltransferase [Deltaproteobacteria bacterium]